LLPAAMLDGGHVSRSLFGEKTRSVLTALSIVALFFVSWPMAIFVLFLSMYKHPGPLDDVSSLSTSRKLLTIGLVAILILSSFFHYLVLYLMYLLRLWNCTFLFIVFLLNACTTKFIKYYDIRFSCKDAIPKTTS
jgi:small-conductance mechanosensitive channel